ncbi:Ribosomal protein L5 [Alkalidesulfovibrio alkalitolerans DSM 16529]|jgi:large subunit ribosomal protein L5|uniref:Large ribosomal subunit protein uL5 n=1 Tax=Alkalidesulfovibrio alkalitolerans DSM 16529 TaxID=1121439 RepID=S7TC26_9BACT|nr:50S ribosomal protein L5 [Alkalidesulfovibrio alkalitolerans]EPR34722.1 Ribosomal protein L5 [Alkalidesulfovibrio alkalitolerans DSM 16529]
MTTLEKLYKEKIAPELTKEFGYKSSMQIPRLRSVHLNIGLGEASQNHKLIEEAVNELTRISGQKAVITKAKKSIASFKLREGQPVGCRVTLRGERMWDFIDKLVNFSLPRVRDFRGVQDKGFDGRGNFTMGVREHTIFPEIDIEKVDRVKGMNITFVTTASSDKESKQLLSLLGMPFRK